MVRLGEGKVEVERRTLNLENTMIIDTEDVEDVIADRTELNEAREALSRQIEKVDEKLIRHAVKTLTPVPDFRMLVITFEWGCKDPRNEIQTCIYNEYEDECHDTCLFCGKPEERK